MAHSVKSGETSTRQPVHIRLPDEARALIDRAARARGKNRTDFMIEASVAAAEDALLDQTMVKVDAETYDHFLKVLDQPPDSEGFRRLMSAPKLWKT
jgi:uncharacterized protein (DUF1778 family)